MRLLSDYQVVRASAPSTFACLGDRAKVLLQGNLILPEGRQPTNRKGESLIMKTAARIRPEIPSNSILFET